MQVCLPPTVCLPRNFPRQTSRTPAVTVPIRSEDRVPAFTPLHNQPCLRKKIDLRARTKFIIYLVIFHIISAWELLQVADFRTGCLK